MTTAGRKPSSTSYVDRFTLVWVVRDPEGKFWTVPCGDGARERLLPTEASELEPVPGLCKHGFCSAN